MVVHSDRRVELSNLEGPFRLSAAMTDFICVCPASGFVCQSCCGILDYGATEEFDVESQHRMTLTVWYDQGDSNENLFQFD
jgi:hypothetical protein